MKVACFRVVVRGQVQGLGFRPHVFRLARKLGVAGTVANSGKGVVVVVQGSRALCFLAELRRKPPRLAFYSSFVVKRVRPRPLDGFRIIGSGAGVGGVDVLPDLAICPDCRREVCDPRDRRHAYAFTNCTLCGPRYTIIERLPYDRPRTTMRGFRMCPRCRAEYLDPRDRRFHAQPVACPDCGPRLCLLDRVGTRLSAPLERAAKLLLRGRIVALKGLGGFQLACDATNDTAVRRLRSRKGRPAKPFAIMCLDTATARRLCRLTRADADLLVSPAAPILLAPRRTPPTLVLSDAVAPRNPNLGIMLANTPLHLLLFQELVRLGRPGPVLVMTSANRADDPITASVPELLRQLGNVPDAILDHDRPIANRCDDSVVLPGPLLVRRARGYAPSPVRFGSGFHVKHAVLAVGAEWKNAFVLAHQDKAYPSPHIGTVSTASGERFWLKTLACYERWAGIRPRVVACDLHPDYLSTRLAERIARSRGLRLVRVQHHFAHILSVMAEHAATGPVLGLAFDGTGYGTDGNIWGCEFLLVRSDLSWERLGHLGYLPLARAGDEVADPSVVASAYMDALGLGRDAGCVRRSASGVLTSSLGRLFDAVAGITGVLRRASFDAEAAIALEAAAVPRERGHYFSPDLIDVHSSPARILPKPIIASVSREALAGVPAGLVSARFHNTLVRAASFLAVHLARQHGLTTVCLSGGSFQNTLIRAGVCRSLLTKGLRPLLNAHVPANDGGIALGQAIAANCRP